MWNKCCGWKPGAANDNVINLIGIAAPAGDAAGGNRIKPVNKIAGGLNYAPGNQHINGICKAGIITPA